MSICLFGMVSYLEVVDVERTLEAQRRTARILGRRLETSVFLIKALGGGWDEGEEEGKVGKVASTYHLLVDGVDFVDRVDEERFAERSR